MKNLILSLSFLSVFGCSSATEKNESFKQGDTVIVSEAKNLTKDQPESLETKEEEKPVEIDNLTGTIWLRRPFEEFPHCVDTLNFIDDSTGYEYRCEFESTNKIDYFYSGDTLEIHEYGHVSEVHDLGLEVKYRLQYIRTNNRLNLSGYGVGSEQPISPRENDLTYQLLKNE